MKKKDTWKECNKGDGWQKRTEESSKKRDSTIEKQKRS